MHFIANARMYAVTPKVEAAWQALIGHIAVEAEVPLAYEAYPAPRPLEVLWQRADLGAVLMCGYPLAMHMGVVHPLAAPIPSFNWAGRRAVYRTDLIVHRDSDFVTLEDTFGKRAGWTVEHSQSGFNAFRHHLLTYRTEERPTLYGEIVGNLITARAVLEAVKSGAIDVGPLDAFWHGLLARHKERLTRDVRVIATTAAAPIPTFVCSLGLGTERIRRLKAAFVAASSRSWFAPLGETLAILGFADVNQATYGVTLTRAREAEAAGYPYPA